MRDGIDFKLECVMTKLLLLFKLFPIGFIPMRTPFLWFRMRSLISIPSLYNSYFLIIYFYLRNANTVYINSFSQALMRSNIPTER